MFKELIQSIRMLAHEVREWRLAEQFKDTILERMVEMERNIMATQAEIVADLKLVTAQLKKLDNDTKTLQTSVDTANSKIVELEAIIAAGGTITQELIDAVAAVKAAVQVVDDNVPEVPTPAP